MNINSRVVNIIGVLLFLTFILPILTIVDENVLNMFSLILGIMAYFLSFLKIKNQDENIK